MLRFIVDDEHDGQRVDVFVAEKLKDLSRSFINQLADDGRISINNKVVKPSHKLKIGDIIQVDFDLETLENVPKVDLPILYEDNDVLVLDKPAGVLTHSKGSYNPEATVATFIKDKIANMEGNRGGIAHRLDRFTSGVIITAKNPESLKWLQKQFSTRKVQKTYIAVVEGKVEPPEAIIDMPIERNPKKPQTFRTGPNGKPAITKYKTLESNEKYSLLQLRPKTGRTHQLRVHLKQLNHPIVGDLLYGGKPSDRLYLHALNLKLTMPSGEQRKFEAQLPDEFNKMVK